MANQVGGEFVRGWPELIAAVIGVGIGVSSLPFYTAGLFIGPLQSAFGWSLGAASSGNLALSLGLGLAAPLVGRLVDRIGARAVVIPGLLLEAFSFLLLAAMGGSFFQYVGIVFAMGLLCAGASPLSLTKVINARFVRARGLALGFCLMGTGLTAAVAPPILSRVIAAYGWRAGYLALACAVLALTPSALLIRAMPTSLTVEETNCVRADFRLSDGRFWILIVASVLAAASLAGLVIHLTPMLIDLGATPVGAASRVGAIGIAVLSARLLVGAALDRLPAPWVGAVLMAAAAGGALVLRYAGLEGALLAALSFGLGVGAEVDLIAYLCARYFGLRAYGRAYGLLYGATLLAAGLGPLAFGMIADQPGGYGVVLLLAAGFLAGSAVLLLSLGSDRYSATAPIGLVDPGLADSNRDVAAL
jgi:MFS family permease